MLKCCYPPQALQPVPAHTQVCMVAMPEDRAYGVSRRLIAASKERGIDSIFFPVSKLRRKLMHRLQAFQKF